MSARLAQYFSSPKRCDDSAYINPPSSHVPCQLGHVYAIPSKKPHTSSLISWYVLLVPKGSSKYLHVLLTSQGLDQEKGRPEARQKEQEAKEAASKEGEEALAKETAQANVEKIKDYIKSVETLEGRFCQPKAYLD